MCHLKRKFNRHSHDVPLGVNRPTQSWLKSLNWYKNISNSVLEIGISRRTWIININTWQLNLHYCWVLRMKIFVLPFCDIFILFYFFILFFFVICWDKNKYLFLVANINLFCRTLHFGKALRGNVIVYIVSYFSYSCYSEIITYKEFWTSRCYSNFLYSKLLYCCMNIVRR